jgi:hypothetical protein
MIIEFKTCASIDYPAMALLHTMKTNERLIRKMAALAADAQCRADLQDDTTWSRIAYACHHEVLALQWVNRALQERIDGGPAVAPDTDVLLLIAETMVTLAQRWRGP